MRAAVEDGVNTLVAGRDFVYVGLLLPSSSRAATLIGRVGYRYFLGVTYHKWLYAQERDPRFTVHILQTERIKVLHRNSGHREYI